MAKDIEFHWVPAKQINTALSIDKAQFEHIFDKQEQLTENHYFLCATRENKAVAIAKIYMSPDASNIHLDFLEVAKDARGTHLSRAVIGKLYERAASLHKTLTSDGFTEQGKRLVKIHESFQKQYGQDAYAVIGRV